MRDLTPEERRTQHEEMESRFRRFTIISLIASIFGPAIVVIFLIVGLIMLF
jgi:hypothetical protein